MVCRSHRLQVSSTEIFSLNRSMLTKALPFEEDLNLPIDVGLAQMLSDLVEANQIPLYTAF